MRKKFSSYIEINIVNWESGHIQKIKKSLKKGVTYEQDA
jgi:hypothetical protein